VALRRDTRTWAQDRVHVPTTINIETSCARPQGGRKAASPRHADTWLWRARLCRDTRTRAQDRMHVPTTINIEIQGKLDLIKAVQAELEAYPS